MIYQKKIHNLQVVDLEEIRESLEEMMANSMSNRIAVVNERCSDSVTKENNLHDEFLDENWIVKEENEKSPIAKVFEHVWTEVSPNKKGRMNDTKNVQEEVNDFSSILISPSRFSVLHDAEEG